jgi:hypothetical protein
MENVNSVLGNTPAIAVESTEKSQGFTAACSAMKKENANEGQRIVASSAAMGKPQTFTAACEDMKAQIKDEAQRIVGSPENVDKCIVKPQTSVVANNLPAISKL